MDAMTRIEQALHAAVDRAEAPDCPPLLGAAVRHAVFPRGARIRPRLCLAVAGACGVRVRPHLRARYSSTVRRSAVVSVPVKTITSGIGPRKRAWMPPTRAVSAPVVIAPALLAPVAESTHSDAAVPLNSATETNGRFVASAPYRHALGPV